MNKEKYQIGDNYRNFRPITRAADYPHWSIFAVTRKNFNRLPALADNPHPKAKENRRLLQSSLIVFVDIISYSVQLKKFHTFCPRCFVENDTNCLNLFFEKSIARSTGSEKSLETGNTLYLKAVLAWEIPLMRRIFCSANLLYGATKWTCRHHLPCELPWSQPFHISWILLFSSSLPV